MSDKPRTITLLEKKCFKKVFEKVKKVLDKQN